ncbi:hypothetical protein PINS_up010221 [Pythium insidiosum]|nr:hypothetical protein PINS_up010221 [Pythium insidiosum]
MAERDRKASFQAVSLAVTSFTTSSRNLHVPMPAIPRSTSSRNVFRASAVAEQPTPSQKKAQQLLATRLRRSFSGGRSNDLELRYEVFFHVPTHSELQRLRVHRSLTLVGLQAMIQREFEIPFEDQRLYCHGDLLEGDEDLAYYDIHDQTVINVRVRKRFRAIGDIFSKIKTISFVSHRVGTHASTGAGGIVEDFDIVEVVAPLPPTKIIFRRLVTAISYLQRLDLLQYQKTQRRVWKLHVSYWEEQPIRSGQESRRTSQVARGSRRLSHADLAALARQTSGFVLTQCGPEKVSNVVSLAQQHDLQQRLQLPIDSRSSSDVRHIKRWLANLKYFASANIPDPVIHEIARACGYVRFAAGDFIFRQGDIGDNFYIVISGCVSLASFGNGFFATMTPGRCFGEISLFEGQGLRTASANVNFSAPYAELAILSGDIYRRAINPYKQAVLLDTEKAIYGVPSLKVLPDSIVTHIAYASKTLTSRPGKRLIREGEEMNVLVILVKGEVKVSTPPRSTPNHDVASSLDTSSTNQDLHDHKNSVGTCSPVRHHVAPLVLPNMILIAPHLKANRQRGTCASHLRSRGLSSCQPAAGAVGHRSH